MIAKAYNRHLKIAPKKLRLVANIVRGEMVPLVLAKLENFNHKGSEFIIDTLKSAVANVKNKYPDDHYPEEAMYISKITVDEGPSLSRFRAASMGRASMIIKRSSHLLVELDLVPDQLKKEDKSAEKSEKSVENKKKVRTKKVAEKKATKKKALKGSK